jgi:hypothetical protein
MRRREVEKARRREVEKGIEGEKARGEKAKGEKARSRDDEKSRRV